MAFPFAPVIRESVLPPVSLMPPCQSLLYFHAKYVARASKVASPHGEPNKLIGVSASMQYANRLQYVFSPSSAGVPSTQSPSMPIMINAPTFKPQSSFRHDCMVAPGIVSPENGSAKKLRFGFSTNGLRSVTVTTLSVMTLYS